LAGYVGRNLERLNEVGKVKAKGNGKAFRKKTKEIGVEAASRLVR
jgi:hypothetical protein